MRAVKLSVLGIFVGIFLSACSSNTTTQTATSPSSNNDQVETTPTTQSTGDVETDLSEIENELEGLNTQEDFPEFDESSF